MSTKLGAHQSFFYSLGSSEIGRIFAKLKDRDDLPISAAETVFFMSGLDIEDTSHTEKTEVRNGVLYLPFSSMDYAKDEIALWKSEKALYSSDAICLINSATFKDFVLQVCGPEHLIDKIAILHERASEDLELQFRRNITKLQRLKGDINRSIQSMNSAASRETFKEIASDILSNTIVKIPQKVQLMGTF